MTLRVAVLGAGYFAAFQHEAWTRIPGAHLVAIADAEPARASAAAKAVGCRALPNLDALLDEQPDILDLCIPPAGQAQAIRRGLLAGPRAIICQKPFCTSPEEAETVASEAETAGIPLIVHENFRFQPWWRAIRGALSEGLIGQPYGVSFRLRTGDGQGPRAYLDRQPYFQTMPRLFIHETGVHYIDTFRFLFGDPLAVFAATRRLNPAIAGEDAVHLLMDHPGGVQSHLDANRLSDHRAENLRLTFGEALVEGAAGSLTLTGDGAVHHRAFGSLESRLLMPPPAPAGFAGDCVHALQAHVVGHLTEGTALENTARNYLAVMCVEEAAYRSAETGRKVTLT